MLRHFTDNIMNTFVKDLSGLSFNIVLFYALRIPRQKQNICLYLVRREMNLLKLIDNTQIINITN